MLPYRCMANRTIQRYTTFRFSGIRGSIYAKIWFIEERKQPFGAEFTVIRNYLGDRIRYYRPPIWLG